MPTSLTFRLFGPLEVADEAGHPLDLGTRKQRALVAMLALEPGRVVSLDRLIDELWAGEPPSGATRTLQAYIAHLRRVLEPGRRPRTPPRVLLTREPGYLLAVTPGQVDLARFAAGAEEGRRALARGDHGEARRVLEETLGLWRGEPLGEFAGQEFVRPAVARLRELRDTAVEDRFEARLALGDGGACVPDLEALAEAHPYRERLWGLLVLALYRAGRQADALAALRRVRALLADELGIEPGPQLRRLERAVFEQATELEISDADPGLPGHRRPPTAPGPPPGQWRHPAVPAPLPGHRRSLVAPAPLAPAPPSAPAPAGTATATATGELVAGETLVAREAQLRLVAERLAAARRGDGGVLLVTGEAGIGKTRLALAAADEAAGRGFRVAWGRCVDGAAPAFWPWTQVLRECGGTNPFPGRAASADGGPDPDAALFELYERVAATLTSTGGPLLVVLEDLHWADASSLRLLAFVAGELARHPVLVVATLRPEPGDHPAQLRDTLGALSRERGTERVELAPFGARDVSSYLRLRRVPEDPGLVGVLLERTGGNPFYLGELLRLREGEGEGCLAAGLPAGARDVIERRAARLPEETRELLRAAAVTGREVEIDVLEAVTGIPAERVMALLEPAVASGLLTEPPGGPDYRFSHALVRDALLAGLGRLARARLHLRTGECLEARPGTEPATLAHHFASAARVGGASRAVEHASRAAGREAAQLAYTEAVELWELALNSLPADGGDGRTRCALLTELGQARRTVGDATAARRDLDEAIELALRLGDRKALISAITVAGGLALWLWRPYGVVDAAMVAVLEDLLAGPLDDRDRAALLGTLAVELHYGGPRRAEGERHAARAVEIARGLGDPALLARTLNNYLLSCWVPGRNPERLRAAEEMLALPRLPRATELVARVFRMACLMRAGDLTGWDLDLARCERLVEEVRRPELEAMVRIAQTGRRTLEGRWADAESLATRFGKMGYGSSVWGQEFRLLLTTFTCDRGRGRVAETLDGLLASAEDPSLAPLRPIAVLAALDSGRPDLARELIARWGTEVADDWIADFLIPVWGLVAAELGVPDPGELYDRLAPHADQLIVAGTGSAAWGSTHLVLAELAARLGRAGRAREHAREAAETHRRLGLAHLEERSLRLLARLS
ncbi:AAA family ATPase [Streptosporangium sp. NBC_01495]|uniref:BTAD domain-containing putative transcriptional regulator n=1 Tax=Streptosporangium sp. NBC_01495 TaxID=2903899 RepID=UPI002E348DF5|nr:BTAD domain-containing putative transcriptional regulator [Streptosporangium sp. NBC_01495]